MKLFRTVPMSTWEIGAVKFAVGCIALAIGATWPSIFAPYAKLLAVVGIIVGLYTFYIWSKK